MQVKFSLQKWFTKNATVHMYLQY